MASTLDTLTRTLILSAFPLKELQLQMELRRSITSNNEIINVLLITFAEILDKTYCICNQKVGLFTFSSTL